MFGGRVAFAFGFQCDDDPLEGLVVAAEDFFAADIRASTVLGQGELVEEIVLPKTDSPVKSSYMKYRQRKAIDFPLFSVAVVIEEENGMVKKASIVLGAAAPLPYRAESAEALLVGKELTESLAREAAEEAVKDAIPLFENAYKAIAAKAYIRRAVTACIG